MEVLKAEGFSVDCVQKWFSALCCEVTKEMISMILANSENAKNQDYPTQSNQHFQRLFPEEKFKVGFLVLE